MKKGERKFSASGYTLVFPNSKWQPCWNHVSRGLQGKVRREESLELAQDLRRVYKANSKAEAERALEAVLEKWGKKYPSVKRTLLPLWDELLNFYDFPQELWVSLYATNPVEMVSWEREKLIRPFSRGSKISRCSGYFCCIIFGLK